MGNYHDQFSGGLRSSPTTQAGDLSAGRGCVHETLIRNFCHIPETVTDVPMMGRRAFNSSWLSMYKIINLTLSTRAEQGPAVWQTASFSSRCTSGHAVNTGAGKSDEHMLKESSQPLRRPRIREQGAKDRTSASEKEADVKTGDMETSHMPDHSGRSGITVADQPTRNENALVCQEPQLDQYLSASKNAFAKVINLDKKKFCEKKLAQCLYRIDELRKKAEQNLGFLGGVEAHHIMCSPEYLLYAYQSTKQRVSPGIDGIGNRGVSQAGIMKLAKELKEGSYKPNPTKRIMIPKAKKGEFRPLGIPSIKDKIVQNAAKLILEALFEPTFEDESFGFRPNRGCHTALKQIEYKWPGTTWLLEFDFKKAFDTINHRILMGQLSSRFVDRPFTKLLWQLMKVGYINTHNLIDSKLEMDIGTPQGSILSPILCNIFLDKLDKFVKYELIPKYEQKALGRKISQEYLDHVTSSLCEPASKGRWKNNPWKEVQIAARKVAPDLPYRTLVRSLEKVRAENAKVKGIAFYEKSDIRITYVRYADDFLVGLRGPKKVAKSIVQEIVWFCEGDSLRMQINPEKSGIRHITDGVIFLGYKLFLKQTHRDVTLGEQRAKHTRMMFGVPTERLMKRYAEKGFFQKAKKGKQNKYVARYQSKFVGMTQLGVITRYNSIVKGLVNYYRGSERVSVMGEFLYMLRTSAALTLAHQQKRPTASYALKRWGKNLEITSTDSKQRPLSVSFERPSLSNVNRKWMGGDINELTRKKLVGFAYPKTMTLVRSARDLKCAIPGCESQATQWHHVKHRRKVKGVGWCHSRAVVVAKQIPICRLHHREIHAGKYDGTSLRKIEGYDAGTISQI
jgi:group II intron reverse transcriptase/maturase